jgi:hypothetical protein
MNETMAGELAPASSVQAMRKSPAMEVEPYRSSI